VLRRDHSRRNWLTIFSVDQEFGKSYYWPNVWVAGCYIYRAGSRENFFWVCDGFAPSESVQGIIIYLVHSRSRILDLRRGQYPDDRLRSVWAMGGKAEV
jgi:hypothetical protein